MNDNDRRNVKDFYDHRELVLKSILAARAAEKESKKRK